MEFITGNKIKKICHHTLDEEGYKIIKNPNETEILKIFVKIDYAHSFFQREQNKPYILFTHNGDLPVGDDYLKYMDDPYLITWYGQNINTIHSKLKSIPIGIANEQWEHGNECIILDVINSSFEKDRLIYMNFDINTNKLEREYCVDELSKKNIHMSEKLPFKDYLTELAKSYFVISPNGNGIDCHKTWEALYLKTIPIVTKSINIDYYKNYPILIIEDWRDFNINNITIDMYNTLWNNFNLENLQIKKFIKN